MISVGVPISKLRAHSPRGVVRVARAITERLALVDDIQLFAVSDPFYSGNQVLLECWPMDEWLERHPMAIATSVMAAGSAAAPTIYRAWVHYLVQFLALLHLRGTARTLMRATQPVRAAVKATLRSTADRLGLGQPARHLWRLALRCTYRSSPSLAPYVPPTTVQPVLFDMDESQDPTTNPVCPWPADSDEPLGARGYVALENLDVILSFECFDAIWDWPIELYPCKAIGVFHDAIPFRIDEGRNRDPGGYYRALGKMVARASTIACDSVSSQNDLHVFFPPSAAKTHVVYLGHDCNRFAPGIAGQVKRPRTAATPRLPGSEERKGRAERTRGAGRKKARRKVKRIAMIGDVEPRKNQAAVLRACRFLARLRPHDRLRLVIIGQVPDPNPYLDLELQASRFVDVKWLGYVPDDEIGDILRSCDAFVYASLWEGFGIPLLEAMTAGVPVVCAQNSSLPEVAGDAAFYCDPYDPASISSAIDRALALSPEERAQWTNRAQNRAATFRWSSTTSRFLQLIQLVTGKELATASSAVENECAHSDAAGESLRRAA